MNTFYFATGNENKLREARQILGERIEKIDVGDLDEIQTIEVEELIRHKAKEAFRITGKPVIVEDSGLGFTAWNGLPGALIKWFMGSVGCEGILQMIDSFGDRRAMAVCFVALYDGENFTIASGKVHGTIAEKQRGTTGFGWDTIFIPDGYDTTFAEMEPDEKNKISHRKIAFSNFLREIEGK